MGPVDNASGSRKVQEFWPWLQGRCLRDTTGVGAWGRGDYASSHPRGAAGLGERLQQRREIRNQSRASLG